MIRSQRKTMGFTLLEMILVLVIVSSLMLMFLNYTVRRGEQLRIDRTVLTFQQILNAGLAFYVDNGKWPGCTTDSGCWLGASRLTAELIAKGYIPNGASIVNFYSTPPDFLHVYPDNSKYFSTCIKIPPGESTVGLAETIASRIPMGKTSQNSEVETGAGGPCSYDPSIADEPCDGTKYCYVMGAVSIPGQNLNNARSLNFAGVYHNGACVPAPVCPGTKMQPQIIVAPASVSGIQNGVDTSGSSDVFPINSFTAFAKGPSDWDPQDRTNTGPPRCTSDDSASHEVCQKYDDSGNLVDLEKGKYWRVCLDIVTSLGKISTANNPNWDKLSGSITVATRCVPEAEPAGGTEVFQNY